MKKNVIKLAVIVFALLNLIGLGANAKNYELTSPDQRIRVTVSIADSFRLEMDF